MGSPGCPALAVEHRAKNPTPNDKAIAGQSEAKSTVDGR
jgi:hypothetical protein